jgi:hypothetical protein
MIILDCIRGRDKIKEVYTVSETPLAGVHGLPFDLLLIGTSILAGTRR